jgi:excisionase family DNA binding protein
MSDPRALLDIPSAAARLNLSTSKVWAMCREGRLPGVVRIDKSVRVDPDALDRWIKENSESPRP